MSDEESRTTAVPGEVPGAPVPPHVTAGAGRGSSRRKVLTAIAALVLVAAAAGAIYLAMPTRSEPPGREQVQSLYDSGRLAEAARQGRELVAREPDDLEARRLLALILSAAGDTAGAIEQYDAIVVAAPEDHTTLYRRALLQRVQGDHTAAIADLSKAADLSPGTASYREELAKTHAITGEHDKAVAAWRDALGAEGLTDAQRVAFLRQLAQEYDAAGRSEDARQTWRRVLVLAPDDPQALEELSR